MADLIPAEFQRPVEVAASPSQAPAPQPSPQRSPSPHAAAVQSQPQPEYAGYDSDSSARSSSDRSTRSTRSQRASEDGYSSDEYESVLGSPDRRSPSPKTAARPESGGSLELHLIEGVQNSDVHPGTGDLLKGTHDLQQGMHDLQQGMHDLQQGTSEAEQPGGVVGAVEVESASQSPERDSGGPEREPQADEGGTQSGSEGTRQGQPSSARSTQDGADGGVGCMERRSIGDPQVLPRGLAGDAAVESESDDGRMPEGSLGPPPDGAAQSAEGTAMLQKSCHEGFSEDDTNGVCVCVCARAHALHQTERRPGLLCSS